MFRDNITQEGFVIMTGTGELPLKRFLVMLTYPAGMALIVPGMVMQDDTFTGV